MAKMVNFMLCIFYYNGKKKDWVAGPEAEGEDGMRVGSGEEAVPSLF